MMRHLINRLVQMQANRGNRNALCNLSDYMLRDIGLTRAQASENFLAPERTAPEPWKLPYVRDVTMHQPRLNPHV